MNNYYEHIIESNLSIAWAKAFCAVMKHPEVSPLTVTVRGLSNDIIPEQQDIRIALDESLIGQKLNSCDTVANTIFPANFWNPKKERSLLYKRYMMSRRQIRKCKGNRLGVYFDRLIAYGADYGDSFNQLEYIIETFTQKNNHRRSDLQATILDPKLDKKHQRQCGFPCLQQVGFFHSNKKHLTIIGFYPKEYIYDRGYGNYLGLCKLGQFMAHELGLELTQMTCFIGAGVVGKSKKTPLKPLKKIIGEIIEENESEA
ncbi:MAG: thymidylate synthase [Phycisphaerae bacterium]|nr:thymidylate synthase [Phycisphaerae bacterium]